MKKLHDLRLLLSAGAQLSQADCLKIKGGEGDKRKPRPSNGG